MMRLYQLKDGCCRLEIDADYSGICQDKIRMTFSGRCESTAEVERLLMSYTLAVDFVNRHFLGQEDSENE